MAPKKTTPCQIQSLHHDLLGLILAKVGKESPIDFANTLASCKDMLQSADKEVFCTLNLTPFVKKPKLYYDYQELMDKCLASANLQAHYVKGILCYFNENNSNDAMNHFGIAANGGRKESLYLYGILLLCNDRIEEGKRYLEQLGWMDDTDAADECWKGVKRSLHGVSVERRHVYLDSMVKLEPGVECHSNDLSNTCEKCFHFKQVVKFVFMM